MPSSTQEILERLNAAASQRGLAGPTLTAYRRIWRDNLIRAASAKLDPAALPQAKAGEFYSELTRGRGPSCHLQVKAALALLYRVLEAPKFRPDAVEIRHLEGGRLAKVFLELQRHRRDYFDHLVSHLAEALFFTACRFHKWELLTGDQLARSSLQGSAELRPYVCIARLAKASLLISFSPENGFSWEGRIL